MKPAQKPGKRIVSKGEYVAVQTNRVVLRTSALVSVVEVLVCVALALGLPLLHLGLWGWVAALFFAAMAYHQGRWGLGKLQMIAHLEEVVPLTQANMALLPPVQTLVRASSASGQEQESVLLRAATNEQQTPASQLLRSAASPADTADLPAKDGLVRAGQEPAQAQEAILLRPAVGDTQERHEAQLLRSVVGGQE